MADWNLFHFIFLFLSLVSATYYVHTHLSNIQACKKLMGKKSSLTEHQNGNGQLEDSTPPFFSVLIPARNEASNILACINSILNQDYPKSSFELILIDDNSTDDTVEIVKKEFQNQVEIIKLSDQGDMGKKAAINKGIVASKGDWMVTTDADCQVPESWLSSFAKVIALENPVFIGGPVLFKSDCKSILNTFQTLDIIGMMGVTAGGIHRKAAYLANGANLAYRKSTFEEVDGFQGIDHKASGDDMLLLHKITKAFPNRISYALIPGNNVLTVAEESWTGFYRQRLRWASKGNAFPDFNTWLQMVLVFIFCGCLLGGGLLIGYDPAFFGTLAFFLYLIKCLSDYYYLGFLAKYFNRKEFIASIWWATLLHAVYIFIIGIAAQFNNKYQWKGRNVN